VYSVILKRKSHSFVVVCDVHDSVSLLERHAVERLGLKGDVVRLLDRGVHLSGDRIIGDLGLKTGSQLYFSTLKKGKWETLSAVQESFSRGKTDVGVYFFEGEKNVDVVCEARKRSVQQALAQLLNTDYRRVVVKCNGERATNSDFRRQDDQDVYSYVLV